jgi:hypothetical protein
MELQQFAFRGIPDISTPRTPLPDGIDTFDYNENDAKFNVQQDEEGNKSMVNSITSSGNFIYFKIVKYSFECN